MASNQRMAKTGLVSKLRGLWPTTVEVWIFFTLAAFIFIRIFGSNSFKRIAHVVDGR